MLASLKETAYFVTWMRYLELRKFNRPVCASRFYAVGPRKCIGATWLTTPAQKETS